jgi:hypothetical protein
MPGDAHSHGRRLGNEAPAAAPATDHCDESSASPRACDPRVEVDTRHFQRQRARGACSLEAFDGDGHRRARRRRAWMTPADRTPLQPHAPPRVEGDAESLPARATHVRPSTSFPDGGVGPAAAVRAAMRPRRLEPLDDRAAAPRDAASAADPPLGAAMRAAAVRRWRAMAAARPFAVRGARARPTARARSRTADLGRGSAGSAAGRGAGRAVGGGWQVRQGRREAPVGLAQEQAGVADARERHAAGSPRPIATTRPASDTFSSSARPARPPRDAGPARAPCDTIRCRAAHRRDEQRKITRLRLTKLLAETGHTDDHDTRAGYPPAAQRPRGSRHPRAPASQRVDADRTRLDRRQGAGRHAHRRARSRREPIA